MCENSDDTINVAHMVETSKKLNCLTTDINENLNENLPKTNPKKDYAEIELLTEDNIKLKDKLTYQQKTIDLNTETIKHLEEKCLRLEELRKDIEIKLEESLKEKENALKEKEAMVIRYAVGEKNVIKETQLKCSAEKKLKETLKENELLQHKVQIMITEKSRICQMLDNKCYENKNLQQELDKLKVDLNALETKLKWSQNSLKTEIETHKECQIKVESLSGKLDEAVGQIELAKREATDSIKTFQTSQENRAYVLDQQLKELQASLILLKHERNDREQHIKSLQNELERLQTKQKEMLQENNDLSLKVQQLERERLETEQKLSELRGCADQQRRDFVELQTRTVQLEQLKQHLKHEQDQLSTVNDQVELLKERNSELESDMEVCRVREAELLLFTQQLTDKNVRLQSEFTAMETKVQQLSCEQTILKRTIKELETKHGVLLTKSNEDRIKCTDQIMDLSNRLDEALKSLEQCRQEVGFQKGENHVMRRKYELTIKELNKELQNNRKRIDQLETTCESASSSSSISSLGTTASGCENSPVNEHIQVIQPEKHIDKQTLIEHIVKLQRISAKKSEKIDFLEEHVNTLVGELQKKAKLLQGYVLREQSGTLTSNKSDNNKAHVAKLNGVMASLYSSKVVDNTLTLELSLDINRKLQAVLEDALLKNITLKENVDTLGMEIERLNNLLESNSHTSTNQH